jgi:hypothetical protein
MTKVEELRESLLHMEHYSHKNRFGAIVTTEIRHIPTATEIDSLIAAAREEEKERIRITAAGELRIYMTPDCTRHIKVSTGIKPGSYEVISISSLDPTEGE